MACNRPIKGWLRIGGGFTTSAKDAYMSQHLQVPCGQCMGCRLAKTAEWATRIIHEAQLHDVSSFVTLTYDDENINWISSEFKRQYYKLKLRYINDYRKYRNIKSTGATLNKNDLQKFFKRLRKSLYPNKIRYFAAGEYGKKCERPHYHIIVFGYWPKDCKEVEAKNVGKGNEYKWYESDELNKIWKKGNVIIGKVTFESAAYTASYVTKKINGSNKRFHYYGREPESGFMSRNPGIAKGWIDKYYKQSVDLGTVIRRGHEVALPRFYKEQIKKKSFTDMWKLRLRNKCDKEKKMDEVYDNRFEVTEEYLKKKQKFFEKDEINT